MARLTRMIRIDALGAIALMLLLGAMAHAAETDPFIGKFAGKDTIITIEKAAKGYKGLIKLREQSFTFEAKAKGTILSGEFQFKGNGYPFSARLNADSMSFKTGKSSVNLERVKPKAANPFDQQRPESTNPFDKPAKGGSTTTIATAKPAHPLEGKWEDEFESIQIIGNKIVYIDKDDPKEREVGILKIEKNQVTISFAGETEKYTFQIKGDTLTLIDSAGDKEIFKRVAGKVASPINAQAFPSAALTRPKVAATNSDGLNGVYTGPINGTPGTVTLKVKDQKLTGTIIFGGNTIQLTGQADKTSAQGIMLDKLGSKVPFVATLKGGTLSFTMVLKNPNTGQEVKIPYSFSRKTAASGANASSNASSNFPATKPTDEKVERDRQLVGRWLYTFTQSSGGFSVAIDTHMIINADGSYLYGDSKGGAGGDSGSIISEGGGDVTKGKWRTQNGIVYVQQEGASQWVGHARYTISGNSMLFTFGDGSKRLWKRN